MIIFSGYDEMTSVRFSKSLQNAFGKEEKHNIIFFDQETDILYQKYEIFQSGQEEREMTTVTINAIYLCSFYSRMKKGRNFSLQQMIIEAYENTKNEQIKQTIKKTNMLVLIDSGVFRRDDASIISALSQLNGDFMEKIREQKQIKLCAILDYTETKPNEKVLGMVNDFFGKKIDEDENNFFLYYDSRKQIDETIEKFIKFAQDQDQYMDLYDFSKNN